LFDELETEPGGEDAGVDGNAAADTSSTDNEQETVVDASSTLHAVMFRFHARPTLKVTMALQVDGELDEAESTECSTAIATDLQTGETVAIDSPENLPRWMMRAGDRTTVSTSPIEHIKFPSKEDPSTCDWVDGNIAHFSRLGLTAEEMKYFKLEATQEGGGLPTLVPEDATSPEYKDFATVLNRSMPQSTKLADFSRCVTRGDSECNVRTSHATRLISRADFSSDPTCTVTDAGNLEIGYSSFVGGFAACTAQWAEFQRHPGRAKRVWHRLD